MHDAFNRGVFIFNAMRKKVVSVLYETELKVILDEK